jgi:hypothetical protein
MDMAQITVWDIGPAGLSEKGGKAHVG